MSLIDTTTLPAVADNFLPAAIFAPAPSPKTSERYVHINTSEIISMLRDDGYQIASAIGTRVSKKRIAAAAKAGEPVPQNPFGKHVVILRHADAKPLPDGSVPQVLLVNAHDGSKRLSLTQGVFRFVCSNGMVVGTSYASHQVRHFGSEARDAIARISKAARDTSELLKQMTEWSKRELTEAETIEFATCAAVLRFGDVARFDPKQLLTIRRPEDDRRDLWTVFNRVQEATVRGGLLGFSSEGRRLRSRTLEGVGSNFEFNRSLWSLAAEFAE